MMYNRILCWLTFLGICINYCNGTKMSPDEIVLNATKVSCDKSAVTLTGEIIKLSDIIIRNGEMLRPCIESITGKLLRIYASQRVEFDSDFNFRGLNVNIVIISPEWYITGKRFINLNGRRGPSHSLTNYEVHKGQPGSAGSPGLPGGAGGNFLGIYEKLTLPEKSYLYLTANGGTGGAGQRGGNGGDGYDGQRAAKVEEEFGREMVKENIVVSVFYNQNVETHLFFGKSGKMGAPGGDGGIGGYGGQPGSIQLFDLNYYENSSHIITRASAGFKGNNGDGGLGGLGGMPGEDLIAYFCKRFVLGPIPVELGWCWQSTKGLTEKYVLSKKPRALSGGKGKTGLNTENIKFPESPRSPPDIPKEISGYKTFLLKTSDSQDGNGSAVNFLKNICNDKNIIGCFTTTDVLSEVYDLVSNHAVPANVGNDLILLDILQNFTFFFKNNENISRNQNIALNTAYSALLSKITLLNMRFSNAAMIVNLLDYLKIAKDNIKELQKLEEKSSKLNVIKREEEKFNTALVKKIEEANYFINDDIMPAIERAGTQIQEKMHMLVDEIVAMQARITDERDSLIEEKTKLGRKIIISSYLSVLKEMHPALGTAVGAAKGIMKLADSGDALSAISNDNLNLKHFDDPQNFLSSLKIIDKTQSNYQQFAQLNETIELLSNQLIDSPEVLNDTLNTISVDFTKLINEGGVINNVYERVNKAIDDKKLTLEQKNSELEPSDLSYEKNNQTIKNLERVQKVAKVGSIGMKTYQKFANDIEKRKALDEAIDNASDKITALEKKRSHVNSQVLPMLVKAQSSLKTIAVDSSNKSIVSLDMTKWGVQSTLKSLKLHLQQLTKDFDVEEELVSCVEKLEESMTILINIYDRIQSYTERQQLVNFLGKINSPIDMSDAQSSQLQNFTDLLDIEIRKNVILQQYKFALFALKQQVFPFAHRYLKTSVFFGVEEEHDFNTFVDNSMREMEVLRLQLETYYASLQEHDAYVSCGPFSNEYESTKPFFAWKQNKYKDAILKLLSGNSIILKADIADSPSDKYAIKFSSIDLKFTSSDDTINSNLKNELKRFELIATHLGNSYYRYKDKFYLILGDSINIKYSFERNDKNVPIHRNIIYDKLESGDLTLSPFAFWKFNIVPAVDNANFSILSMYHEHIELQLNGYACYLSKQNSISAIDVDKYYNIVN